MRMTFKQSMLAAVLAVMAPLFQPLSHNAVLAQGLPSIGAPLGAGTSPSSLPRSTPPPETETGAETGTEIETRRSGATSQQGGAVLDAATNQVTVEVVEGVRGDVLMSSGRDTGQATGPVTTRASVIGVGDNATEADQQATSRLSGLSIEGAIVTEPTADPVLLGDGITHTSRIVWDSVTRRDPDGDIRRIYLREPLESEVGHVGDVPALPSGSRMTARGNLNAVLSAAGELAAGGGEAVTAGDGSGATTGAATARVGDPSSAGSSSSGDDTETAAITSPEVTSDEDLPVITVTTDGCPVEIDRTNNVVYRHSRTLTDGQETVACSRDGTTFAINKTATGCAIEEDLANRVAYPTYSFFYTDDNGARITVSEACETVEGESYTMVERADQCGYEENIPMLAVYEQAEIGYTVASGEFVIVQGCERVSDTPVATMEYTEDGCGTRTDQVTGAVTQLQRLHYVVDVNDVTVLACAETDASVTWFYSTDGCAVVIDEDAGVARMTEQLFIDDIGQGDCQPNGTNFPLQRTTTGCAVETDLAAMKAFPTFTTYYVDNSATQQIVHTCRRGDADEDYYAMFESTASCSVTFDYTAMEVFEQSALMYRLPTGTDVEVLNCRVPDGALAAAPIDGCALHDDFGAGVTYQQQKYFYTLSDGVERTAQTCQTRDTSPRYAHARLLCGEEADTVAGTHALRYKVRIEIDGIPYDRTACLIDESTVVAMTKVTDTCASLFSHDVPNDRSFGYSRYQYIRDGIAEYATTCEVDPAILFDHLITDPIAWRNDDPNRQAMALREVFFDAYDQRVLVQSASVLESEAPTPYTFVEASLVDGTPEYAGCTKTTPQLETAVYRRPDTTLMYEATGEEDTPVVTDGCTSVAQTPLWRPTSKGSIGYVSSYCVSYQTASNEGGQSQACGAWEARCQVTARYEGTRVLNREDGQTVTQTSADQPSASTSFTTGAINGMGVHGSGDNGNCAATGTRAPDPWTGSEQTQWNQDEGW